MKLEEITSFDIIKIGYLIYNVNEIVGANVIAKWFSIQISDVKRLARRGAIPAISKESAQSANPEFLIRDVREHLKKLWKGN